MSEENQQPDSSISKALKILAYPVSGLLGLWTARVGISDAAYDIYKNYPVIKEIREKWHKASDKMIEEANARPASENNNVAKEMAKGRKTFMKDVVVEKEKLGIKGVFKELELMHPTEKQSVLINALTIGGVSLGAMLMAANMKIFNKHSKDSDQSTER